MSADTQVEMKQEGQELTVLAISQLDAASSLAIQDHFGHCGISPYGQISGIVVQIR
jgi:hypothetical protein